jgi:hypothetical protein
MGKQVEELLNFRGNGVFYPCMLTNSDRAVITKSMAYPVIMALHHEMGWYVLRMETATRYVMANRLGLPEATVYVQTVNDKGVVKTQVGVKIFDAIDHGENAETLLVESANMKYILNRLRKSRSDTSGMNLGAISTRWCKHIPTIVKTALDRYYYEYAGSLPEWRGVTDAGMSSLLLRMFKRELNILDIDLTSASILDGLYGEYMNVMDHRLEFRKKMHQMFSGEKWIMIWNGRGQPDSEFVLGAVKFNGLDEYLDKRLGIGNHTRIIDGEIDHTLLVAFQAYKDFSHLPTIYEDSIMSRLTFDKIARSSGEHFTAKGNGFQPVPRGMMAAFHSTNSMCFERTGNGHAYYMFNKV